MTMIVAVADAGNISRAAEVVHRSQSAVSMQIKTLETALGKPLFVRKPRSVVPTQDGEVLLAFARRMLALRDEAWAAVVRPGRDRPREHRRAGRLRVVAAAAHPQEIFRDLSEGRDSGGPPAERRTRADGEGRFGRSRLRDAREGVRQESFCDSSRWCGRRRRARDIWRERPLPHRGVLAWQRRAENAIRSLEQARISYRTSYESPSLMGLVSDGRGWSCGRSARAMRLFPRTSRCSARRRACPKIAALEVVLARKHGIRSAPPCDFLAEKIIAELRR